MYLSVFLLHMTVYQHNQFQVDTKSSHLKKHTPKNLNANIRAAFTAQCCQMYWQNTNMSKQAMCLLKLCVQLLVFARQLYWLFQIVCM